MGNYHVRICQRGLDVNVCLSLTFARQMSAVRFRLSPLFLICLSKVYYKKFIKNN